MSCIKLVVPTTYEETHTFEEIQKYAVNKYLFSSIHDSQKCPFLNWLYSKDMPEKYMFVKYSQKYSSLNDSNLILSRTKLYRSLYGLIDYFTRNNNYRHRTYHATKNGFSILFEKYLNDANIKDEYVFCSDIIASPYDIEIAAFVLTNGMSFIQI